MPKVEAVVCQADGDLGGMIVFARPNGTGAFVSVIIVGGRAYLWQAFKWGVMGWFTRGGIRLPSVVAERACDLARHHMRLGGKS